MARKSWKTDKTPQQLNEERRAKVNEIKETTAKKIIDLIQSGQSLEWRKSWKGNPLFNMPHNAVTGHQFSGFNRMIAMMEMYDRDSNDSRFMTFDQVRKFNDANGTECHVKKDGKSVRMLQPFRFNKKSTENDKNAEDSEAEDNQERRYMFFTPYPIFHASQIEGLPPQPEPAAPDWEKDDFIESLIEASGAEVRHGGDRAFYNRGKDYMGMPFPADFDSKGDYYATKLHEWYHWTGHLSREDRQFGSAFGDANYAIEELRAESFSVLASMAIGIPPHFENHASYLKSWSEKTASQDGIEDIMRCVQQAGEMLDVVMEFKNGAKPGVDWWPETPEASLSAR